MSRTPTPKTTEEIARFRELAELNNTEFLKRLLEIGEHADACPSTRR